MKEEEIDYTGQWLFAIKSDLTFGINKGNGYKIISVENDFMLVRTEKFADGIGFKLGNKLFMSIEDSKQEVRLLKLKKILNGTKNQTYLQAE